MISMPPSQVMVVKEEGAGVTVVGTVVAIIVFGGNEATSVVVWAFIVVVVEVLVAVKCEVVFTVDVIVEVEVMSKNVIHSFNYF